MKHEKYAWKTSLKNGPQLSVSEQECLSEIFFKNSTIFRWRSGDVLVVDNIKTAHGRLNIDAPRTIHVFLSEYVDQRNFAQTQPII